jgi:hypothetical protein
VRSTVVAPPVPLVVSVVPALVVVAPPAAVVVVLSDPVLEHAAANVTATAKRAMIRRTADARPLGVLPGDAAARRWCDRMARRAHAVAPTNVIAQAQSGRPTRS